MQQILPVIYILLFALITNPAVKAATMEDNIQIENISVKRVGSDLKLTADINLDKLKLGSNRQIYLTPVLEDPEGSSVTLPALLINGRAMHIAYERKSLSGKERKNHEVGMETRRKNGKKQTVTYITSIPFEDWMWKPSASLKWVLDSCGCGNLYATDSGISSEIGLNPAPKMRVAYMTPAVKPLPVSIHEGKAQVKYEVAKSELHTEPYICKNGQRIDNRHELQIIDDSIFNALNDKNVEISKIKICGYASPEGSFLGNEKLSTDRSRSLAQYLGERYRLPAEATEYDAVAENWKGLREIVETADILTASQRSKLLSLIDQPAYGPADYDVKDLTLRTNPEFSELYRSVILPKWYPQLRTTKFEISTRLKPLSDEELAEVIRISPEKMSLNQIFRVAKLYPEGSEEFNHVIDTALKYYPEDETANLNAASAALKSGELKRASLLLEKAGDSPEANNARGILAVWVGELDRARELFRGASILPEAAKNLELLGNE